jgi:hypothetical protein
MICTLIILSDTFNGSCDDLLKKGLSKLNEKNIGRNGINQKKMSQKIKNILNLKTPTRRSI